MSERTTFVLPVLPLTRAVVLPGMVITIAVESPEATAAVEAAGDDGRLLLVPHLDGRPAPVGVVATIQERGILPGGGPALVVRAEDRALLRTAVAGTGDARWLEAEPVHPEITDEARELAAELRATYRALFEGRFGPRFAEVLRDLTEPDALADAAGWWAELTVERKLDLLVTLDVAERVRKVTGWAKDALAEAELTAKIRTDVTEGMEQRQREFLLRQQLDAIRRELGDTAADDDPDSYRAKLAELDVPDEVRTAIEREITKLERGSDQSPEQGWIRTWLDTVFEIPWSTTSEDHLDLAAARAVLDRDHEGLTEVKDRIIEDLAVRKLRTERHAADAPGPDAAPRGRHGNATILTLVGPPGVGKTSLGESIAAALGRRFVRVALGGVRDEAEIRGHRRTYVGSRPGRIVRAMIEAGTMNPVVLLDEVDKVGSDLRGDPAAALLEVLDPNQNHSFRDHYLELDLDLSQVIFLATANQLDTISGPLLDRMEVVTLDGYTEDEKVAIARNHLLPRQLTRAGLTTDDLTVAEPALRRIVRDHTREAGVRSLERALAKVVRKVAARVAESPGTTVTVDAPEVRELLGRARFHDTDIADRVAVPGVAAGLAVTGAGGDVLFVEATSVPGPGERRDGDGSLTVTGQLGDVMKESARIALSYVRSHRDRFGIPSGADRQPIHVHFPAGAVPKDGPSAGITMTTALVSLLIGRTVKPNVAMTGEVTLHGRVLPIGGVKQKLLAAHRLGLTEVIIPARNEADLDDVPEHIRRELTVHLAADVADVVDWALEPAPSPTVSLGHAA